MYSRRVQNLTVGRMDGNGSALLKGINSVRPSSLPFLPNLRQLIWSDVGNWLGAEVSDAIVFLHAAMQRCHFYLGVQDDIRPLSILMETIPIHCPSLVSLEIYVWPSVGLLNPLISLLANLPHLVEITIPSFPDVSRILMALSNRPKLKVLQFCYPTAIKNNVFATSFVHTITSPENPSVGDFSLLEVFEFHAQKNATLSPFFQLGALRLHSLNIAVSSLDVDEDLSPESFIRSISRACSGLSNLKLVYRYQSDNTLSQKKALDFDDLRDLLLCTSMTHLELAAPYLVLSDSDIRDMAQAWPSLRRLASYSHNSGPRPGNAKSLSLWSVFLLTRLCPQIEDIALDINTRVSETPSFSSSIPSTGQVADLRFLDVGRLPLHSGDEVDLAKLLGQICGPKCHVVYDRLEEVSDQYEEVASRWVTVTTLMQHFSELYSNVRSLELEIASLRTQIT
ncbi:hypothetical protein VKT23_008035 [Stygiomarasmius scandens]|uniref:F-box domain-containing protein n=1 Tax=Marasmiellus scandens TaxID=2682957 RepID=A0ABR1JJ49_9AGAR